MLKFSLPEGRLILLGYNYYGTRGSSWFWIAVMPSLFSTVEQHWLQ